jgi:RNA polymerase sigma factor (sigma-70 family)
MGYGPSRRDEEDVAGAFAGGDDPFAPASESMVSTDPEPDPAAEADEGPILSPDAAPASPAPSAPGSARFALPESMQSTLDALDREAAGGGTVEDAQVLSAAGFSTDRAESLPRGRRGDRAREQQLEGAQRARAGFERSVERTRAEQAREQAAQERQRTADAKAQARVADQSRKNTERAMADSGVVMKWQPDGTRQPERNADGSLKHTPGWQGEPQQDPEKGKWVRPYRNERGETVAVPMDLTPDAKTDHDTGERYFNNLSTGERIVLGTDPDIVARNRIRAKQAELEISASRQAETLATVSAQLETLKPQAKAAETALKGPQKALAAAEAVAKQRPDSQVAQAALAKAREALATAERAHGPVTKQLADLEAEQIRLTESRRKTEARRRGMMAYERLARIGRYQAPDGTADPVEEEADKLAVDEQKGWLDATAEVLKAQKESGGQYVRPDGQPVDFDDELSRVEQSRIAIDTIDAIGKQAAEGKAPTAAQVAAVEAASPETGAKLRAALPAAKAADARVTEERALLQSVAGADGKFSLAALEALPFDQQSRVVRLLPREDRRPLLEYLAATASERRAMANDPRFQEAGFWKSMGQELAATGRAAMGSFGAVGSGLVRLAALAEAPARGKAVEDAWLYGLANSIDDFWREGVYRADEGRLDLAAASTLASGLSFYAMSATGIGLLRAGGASGRTIQVAGRVIPGALGAGMQAGGELRTGIEADLSPGQQAMRTAWAALLGATESFGIGSMPGRAGLAGTGREFGRFLTREMGEEAIQESVQTGGMGAYDKLISKIRADDSWMKIAKETAGAAGLAVWSAGILGVLTQGSLHRDDAARLRRMRQTLASDNGYGALFDQYETMRGKIEDARLRGDAVAVASFKHVAAQMEGLLSEAATGWVASADPGAVQGVDTVLAAVGASGGGAPMTVARARERVAASPDLGFAAVEIGRAMRESGAVKAEFPSDAAPAARVAFDQAIGIAYLDDLASVATGGAITESRAAVFERLGLAVVMPGEDGRPVLHVTDDGVALLPSALRERIAADDGGGRYRVHWTQGNPQEIRNNLTEAGKRRVAESAKAAVQADAAMPQWSVGVRVAVRQTGAPAGVVDLQVPAQSAAEAAAKAARIVKSRGLQVLGLDGQPVPAAQAKAAEESAANAIGMDQVTDPKQRVAVMRARKALRRWSDLARTLGVDPGAVALTADPRTRSLSASVQGDTVKILINPAGLAEEMTKFGDRAKLDEWIERAMLEEIIHSAGAVYAADQVFGPTAEEAYQEYHARIWAELTDDDRTQVKRLYFGEKGGEFDADWQGGAEFVRIVLQDRWTGGITEGAFRMLQEFVDWLRARFKKAGESNLPKGALAMIEDFEARILAAREKQEAGSEEGLAGSQEARNQSEEVGDDSESGAPSVGTDGRESAPLGSGAETATGSASQKDEGGGRKDEKQREQAPRPKALKKAASELLRAEPGRVDDLVRKRDKQGAPVIDSDQLMLVADMLDEDGDTERLAHVAEELNRRMREDQEIEGADAVAEGRTELLDAIRILGGMPVPKSDGALSGELQMLREAGKAARRPGFFRKTAPPLDMLRRALNEQFGFRFETPADLVQAVQDRLADPADRPVYGEGTAADSVTNAAEVTPEAAASLPGIDLRGLFWQSSDRGPASIVNAIRRGSGGGILQAAARGSRIAQALAAVERRGSDGSDAQAAGATRSDGDPGAAADRRLLTWARREGAIADPGAFRPLRQIEEASEHTVHHPTGSPWVFKVTKLRPIAGSAGYLRRMYLAGVGLGDDVELVGVFGEPGNVGFVVRQTFYRGEHPDQPAITAVLAPMGFEPTSIAGVYDHPDGVMVTDATPNNWLLNANNRPEPIDVHVGTKAAFDFGEEGGGTVTAAAKVDPNQLDLFADLDPNRITPAPAEITTPPQSAEPEPASGAEVQAAESEDVLVPVPAPAPQQIADFGEVIAGARKHKAVKIGPRAPDSERGEDSRPAWARKWKAEPETTFGGYGGERKPTGKWILLYNGRTVYRENLQSRFDSLEEAEAFLPLAEVARNHRVHGIRKGDGFGIYRVLSNGNRPLVRGGFATIAEAQRYMAEHAIEIIEHRFGMPERPWIENFQRTGPQRRKGDVTPAQFQETFGFRGGQFGNWNMGGDGQAALNAAYDGLWDLADALGVPPKAVALNGELAIAFGARGTGGKDSARAHYEPGHAVINLTKMKGGGALAHEWFHALDNYLARQDGKGNAKPERWQTKDDVEKAAYVTTGFSRTSQVREALRDAFGRVMEAISQVRKEEVVQGTAARAVEARAVQSVAEILDRLKSDLSRHAEYLKRRTPTADQLTQWDAIAERILAGDVGERIYVEPAKAARFTLRRSSFAPIEELNALYKSILGRSFAKSGTDNDGSRLFWKIQHLKDARERVRAADAGATETRTVPTQYVMDARAIDGHRASAYWAQPQELGARAFEQWVADKLARLDGGRRSDYLTYGADNKFYQLFGLKPYPENEERARIGEAFDALVDAIETRPTDRGIMIQAAEVDAAMATAAQEYMSGIPPSPDDGTTAADRVRGHLALAESLARAYGNIPGIDAGEAPGEARKALVMAARDYDPGKGAFVPFAARSIRNALNTLFSRAVRRVRREVVSLDSPAVPEGEDPEDTIGDMTAAPGATAANEAANADGRRVLEEIVSTLPPRLQTVVRARFMAGESLEATGQRLGISKQGALRLEKIALDRLRAKLAERGIGGADDVWVSRTRAPIRPTVTRAADPESTRPTLAEEISRFFRRGVGVKVDAGLDREADEVYGRPNGAFWEVYDLAAGTLVDRIDTPPRQTDRGGVSVATGLEPGEVVVRRDPDGWSEVVAYRALRPPARPSESGFVYAWELRPGDRVMIGGPVRIEAVEFMGSGFYESARVRITFEGGATRLADGIQTFMVETGEPRGEGRQAYGALPIEEAEGATRPVGAEQLTLSMAAEIRPEETRKWLKVMRRLQAVLKEKKHLTPDQWRTWDFAEKQLGQALLFDVGVGVDAGAFSLEQDRELPTPNAQLPTSNVEQGTFAFAAPVDRVVQPGDLSDAFLNVPFHTGVAALRRHPAFEAAKYGGDDRAAVQLVDAFYKFAVTARLRPLIARGKPLVIVPVLQEEHPETLNRIPGLFAERLALDLGGTVHDAIVKVSGRPNTDAGAAERAANVQRFDGPAPEAGSQIIVVDDTFTAGGTLLALIEHLESRPIAAATLAAGRYQAWLKPSATKIDALLAKAEVDAITFKRELGFAPTALTGSEIQQYLLNGAAGIAGVRRRFGEGVRGSVEGSGEGKPGERPADHGGDGDRPRSRDRGDDSEQLTLSLAARVERPIPGVDQLTARLEGIAGLIDAKEQRLAYLSETQETDIPGLPGDATLREDLARLHAQASGARRDLIAMRAVRWGMSREGAQTFAAAVDETEGHAERIEAEADAIQNPRDPNAPDPEEAARPLKEKVAGAVAQERSLIRQFYETFVRGKFDRLNFFAPGSTAADGAQTPGAGDVLIDQNRKAALAAAGLREWEERFDREVAEAFGGFLVAGTVKRPKVNRFKALLHPYARRLNQTGTDTVGNPIFGAFWMKAGELKAGPGRAYSAGSVFTDPVSGEKLRVGEVVLTYRGERVNSTEAQRLREQGKMVEEFYQLERFVSVPAQHALHATFHRQFPQAAHLLDLWIAPGKEAERFTDARGNIFPIFNRGSLWDYYRTDSAFGALKDPLPGYVPDVVRTRSLAGMIGAALLRTDRTAAARSYKSGAAAEKGDVLGLKEGFKLRVAQAHEEKIRRETAEALLKTAVQEVPESGPLPPGFTRLDRDFFNNLITASRVARSMGADFEAALSPQLTFDLIEAVEKGKDDELSRLAPGINPAVIRADIELLRSLVGDPSLFDPRKMIRQEIKDEIAKGFAVQAAHGYTFKVLQFFVNRNVTGMLAHPFSAIQNMVSNEIFKSLRVLQRAYYGIFSGLLGNRAEAGTALREAGHLVRGMVLDRWFNPGARRAMDAIAPVELYDRDTALQGLGAFDPDASIADDLRALNIGGAFLKLVRYGNMDARTKQQLAYAAYRARAEVAADAAGIKGEARADWMRDWVQAQPPGFHRQVRAVATAYAMDYANVPVWMDETHRVQVGGNDVTDWANLVRRLSMPFAKYPYNYARQMKRMLWSNGLVAGLSRTATKQDRAEAFANVAGATTMMSLLAALMMGGGDDEDEASTSPVGISRDTGGKPLEPAFNTVGRVRVDGPMRDLVESAIRMTGEEPELGDDYWVRIRSLPYVAPAMAGMTLAAYLQAMANDPGAAPAKRAAAADQLKTFFAEFVSQGMAVKLALGCFGDYRDPFNVGVPLSTMAGESAVDLLLSPVAPSAILGPLQGAADPVGRNRKPAPSLGYDPGFMEGVKASLPFASRDLPPSGRIVQANPDGDRALAAQAELDAMGEADTAFNPEFVNKAGQTRAAFVDPETIQHSRRWREILRLLGLNVKAVDREGYFREVNRLGAEAE